MLSTEAPTYTQGQRPGLYDGYEHRLHLRNLTTTEHRNTPLREFLLSMLDLALLSSDRDRVDHLIEAIRTTGTISNLTVARFLRKYVRSQLMQGMSLYEIFSSSTVKASLDGSSS